jgi:hypothetical protein
MVFLASGYLISRRLNLGFVWGVSVEKGNHGGQIRYLGTRPIVQNGSDLSATVELLKAINRMV